jgi:bifunctional ADP-heptose synthase (sugar kinase/adenylyltransferase)
MNHDRFLAITTSYPRLKIAVVGDFFLDRYLYIDPAKEDVSIETGLKVHNVVKVRPQPGAAGTIVNNLVALGIGEIHAVGFCGDDGEGYELRRELARLRGVVVSDFLTVASRRTPVYGKPMVIEPHRSPRELNRFDCKNWSPTPDVLQRDLAGRVLALADRVDAMIVLDQVELPDTGVVTQGVKQAVHAAQVKHPSLFVIADSRQGVGDFPPMAFKMNALELGRMTGSMPEKLDAIGQEAGVLAGRTQRPVFVTLADRGIIGCAPGHPPDRVAALPVRGPIDIVGAGDAVTANLTAALATGSGLCEAMELAMVAASHVIHQLGTTGTASVAQIREIMT